LRPVLGRFDRRGRRLFYCDRRAEGGRLNEGRQRVMVGRCQGLYALAVRSTTALAWRIYLHQIRTEPGVGVKEVWIDAPTLKRS